MARFIAFALVWLLGIAPAQAEWRRAESPNFVVYSEGSESRLRARILLLEEFDRLLRTVTSVTAPPAPTKLHVYIVGGPQELRVLRPFGAGVAGFYAATPHGIAAFVDGQAQTGENEVLFHEYAHHFMMQYAPGTYPLWYVEGFAEYLSTARFSQRTISIGNRSEGRGYSLMMTEWLPMERILFGDMSRLRLEQRAQFYAQSWLTVHYFHSTPEREAALRRYLAAPDGRSPEAFEAATGIAPRDMVGELRRYIGRGRITYTSMPRASAEAPPPVTVTVMPRSADDLMLYEAALRIGIHEANEASTLARIRAAAARHGQDPFARRVLAHAELLHGDVAAADRLLDALLAAAPEDAGLMYLKGLRHLSAAEKADDWESEARAARRWFTRAHRADANHFQTLYRFAQSMRYDPDYASENTSNVLLLAHSLAPQVSEITMAAAAMLMNRDRFEHAEALLRPLAADPHNAELAQAAQELLQQARSRTRPEPVTEEAAPEE